MLFRFAHPLYLYLLLLIPVFVAIFVALRYQRKRNLKKFGDPELIKHLMPEVSSFRPILKFSLLMLALALIVFVLARPQYGTRSEEYKRQGIEAIIAVDVSNSMLCEDISPSRLTKSKMIVSKLIDQLDEDKLGLIAYAGTAVTLLPITSDYVSAKMFLDQLTPKTITLQGTDIGEAINRALAGFSDKKTVGRALILITDAEDNEQGAIEAAKMAKERGIRIFVLSVGTPEGGLIPMGNNSFKKDAEGNVVTTKLNESVGQQIAQAGGGVYLHVDRTDDAQKMLETEIAKMQKDDITTSMYSEYDEQFVAVAILLFIVLIIEICIMDRKNNVLKRFRLFKTAMLLVVMHSSLFCAEANAQSSDRDYIRLGNKYFREKNYVQAETNYRKALEKKPSLEVYYNLANSVTYQGNDSIAFENYKKALGEQAASLERKAYVFHNMGNLSYASGIMQMKSNGQDAGKAFQQAVELYKSALRCNPKDDETRYNLAMAQFMLKKNQNNQGGGGNNDQNKDNKDQNKDKNKDQNKDNKDQDKDNKDKNQDQNKDNKENKDNQDKQNQQNNQNKDKNQQDKQKQQPQPQSGQIDDKTAEQLLNSAQQDEKAVQRKVQKGEKAHRRGLEKDW